MQYTLPRCPCIPATCTCTRGCASGYQGICTCGSKVPPVHAIKQSRLHNQAPCHRYNHGVAQIFVPLCKLCTAVSTT